MCGITGTYAFNEVGRIFSIHLEKAMNTLEKRGPDAKGSFRDYRTALGHRRLSIIDLSPKANQPMEDEQGRYVLVFCGEIYNFKSIRNELQKRNIIFQTNSDTEVLLKLYILEKEECLKKLNGFFAFAIYDKKEKSLFLARDRVGIKPLWYYLDEDKFLFASEMRALLAYNIPKKIDYTSLYQYFQLTYIPAPQSILKNIYKLLPGHYIRLKEKKLDIKAYYTVRLSSNSPFISYSKAQKKLISLLEESVSLRMISDVPLGTFLSGGIDSSLIVALASKFTSHLNTFSIAYKDEPLFDETYYANQVAERYQTNHTVFELKNNDFYEILFDLLDYMGEPFADSSAIPTYILSQNTRKKVKVALSGDGADELFGGYYRHAAEWMARKRRTTARIIALTLPLWTLFPKTRHTFIGNKIRQLHRFAECMTYSSQDRYWYLSSWQPEYKMETMLSRDTSQRIVKSDYLRRKNILTQNIQGNDFNEVLISDVYMLLPNDMLYKVDTMSMANSLEVRTPFLDHRMINFAFSLPSEYKIDRNMKKKVLQDAARSLLPKELYNRPKHGFDVPLSKGYKTTLRSWIENDILEENFIKEQGIFNTRFIERLKRTLFKSQNFDQNQVWSILAFQHWWKRIFNV